MVTIAKFMNLGEAKLAQGKLTSAGISAFVCDENMHAIGWHMGLALGGIRLQVPDSQLVRALEVLDDFAPEPVYGVGDDDDAEDEEEVDCCPECDSLEIREVAGTPRQITLWSAAIPFPELPFPENNRRRWKCMACGFQWEEETSD